MDTSQGLDLRGSLVFKSHEGNNKIIVITIIILRIRKNKELTKTTTTSIAGDMTPIIFVMVNKYNREYI